MAVGPKNVRMARPDTTKETQELVGQVGVRACAPNGTEFAFYIGLDFYRLMFRLIASSIALLPTSEHYIDRIEPVSAG